MNSRSITSLALSAGAALAIGAVGLGSANASYNWGDNGYGACQNNYGESQWTVTGNCIQSLSGWVTVKGWTIYNATATCEDSISGPYPTQGSGSPFVPYLQGFVYSGQAFLNWANTNTTWPANGTTTSNFPYDGGGVAWQGSSGDITGDVPETVTLQLGNWNTNLTNAPTTWGTAHMAFGDTSPYSHTAQYAMACIGPNIAIGQNSYASGGLWSPNGVIAQGSINERPAAGATAMARESAVPAVRHNPRPAERNMLRRHAETSRPTLTRWRRVTLRPNVQRTFRMACPGGYQRTSQVDLTPEYAPKNMQAPTAAQIKGTRIPVLARSYNGTGATVRVKGTRLPVTTMLNAHLTCVKR